MITYEQAVDPKSTRFVTNDPLDKPITFRRNGKTKTWKTRPGHFRIPVKRGLYEYGYIHHQDAHYWDVAKD